MTKEEFESFLQSIGGLNYAYKENYIILNAGFFEMDSGWFGITKTLIEDLVNLGWDKKINQVKEKFGTGRFYTDSTTSAMDDRILQWQIETAVTCERCGSKEYASLRGVGWLQTLCAKCHDDSKS